MCYSLFARIYGEGDGRLLLRVAVSELKKMGFDKVFLWVFYMQVGILFIDFMINSVYSDTIDPVPLLSY